MTIKHASADSFQVDTQKGVTLVDFWAPWCGPCKMVAPVLEDLSQELDGKASIVKVNVDENPELASRYSIMSIPTLAVFKDGEPVDQVVGFQPKGALAELIHKHI